MKKTSFLLLLVSIGLVAITTHAIEDEKSPEPTWKSATAQSTSEKKALLNLKAGVGRAKKFMAVSANPHASAAAVHILRQGGSAADAAIAAQLVLGLVEPQSSGLGGGGFALYWNAAKKHLHSYDGRETAPAKIDQRHFLDNKNQTMGFWDAVIGGHSVGVPGIPALLAKLHAKHGKLPWSELFVPAIKLAEKGFPVSERLRLLLKAVPKVREHPNTAQYFFADGSLPEVGEILKNAAYALTLKQLQKNGVRSFYKGRLAKQIVAAVQNDTIRSGKLSQADMRAYQVVENQPLCIPYRAYTVCGPPPPSSGGIAVLSALHMLQYWDTKKLSASDPMRIHLFAEVMRIAFANRNTWVADPAAMPISAKTLLDPSYLRERSMSISLKHAAQSVVARKFNIKQPASIKDDEPPSTSHISIIDSYGNIISITSSIEGAFGSRIMVGGFLLNNQLSDFSFQPKNSDSTLVLNRPGPRKKPRSSMSPIIVFRTEGMRPHLVIGSPGGARIINYVAQSIWLYLDTELNLANSLEIGRTVHLNKGYLELEQNHYSAHTIEALTALGHQVKQRRHGSGLHAIAIDSKGHLIGAADPRREGKVGGL